MGFTIYVPNMGGLTHYCPYFTGTPYSIRVSGIILKWNESGDCSNGRFLSGENHIILHRKMCTTHRFLGMQFKKRLNNILF